MKLTKNNFFKESGNIYYKKNIPENSKIKKIGELSYKITDGSHFSPEKSIKGKLFRTVKHMLNNTFSLEEDYLISEKDYQLLKDQNCVTEFNDILLSKDGTIGKVINVKKESDIGLGLLSSISIIRINDGNINNNFVSYVLKSKKIQVLLKNFMSGSALKRMTLKDIKRIPILLLDYEQQNKIAKLLSEKEQHIENIKTLISKLEKRNEYYAEKLLSGELRVRENEKGEIEFYQNTEWKEVKINGRISKMPKDWQINKINEIFNIERGIVLSKEHILKNKGEYPVYSSATLNKGCIGYINTYTHESECLTWTTDGNYAGTVFYRNEKFTPTNICGVLNLKNLNINFNVYYLYLIAKKEFPKMVNKVGNNKLMSNVVEKIELKYPNYIEQDKISYIIDIYEKEKELLENLLKKETKEFEWLSEKLLSGEYIIED